jgi:beta-lactamase class A
MPFIRNRCINFFLIIFFSSMTVFAFGDSLRAEIGHIIGGTNGKVGVAVLGVENNDTLTINGKSRFPMQSVYKYPLAIAVLNQVDKKKLSLDQKIHLEKSDLLPDTWSPLREKYPDGNVDVTLDELLTVTVAQSDNNGCDILFRLMGGPKKVGKYIHSLGVRDISIVATEAEMHKDWSVQYRNWSSPAAMARLLYKFYIGGILSEKSREYLYQVMVKTSTGPGRLKGSLPEGTVVAHKTGSSGEDENGIAPATNDVGIVTLPNGKRFIIVVFVSDSKADEKTRDAVIAKVTKAVWDSYSGR